MSELRQKLLTLEHRSANAIPSMALGGILADVMGLGKTLTMIASIHSTRLTAATFQKGNTDIEMDQPTHLRTSATLVVVTSTREFPFPLSETNGRRIG
jgi:SNF2 family DNA or RNA helicase